MSTITDIKVAKGAKARRHIYLDEQYVCTLDEFTVFKFKLKIGQEISLSYLEEISAESEANSAFEKTIDLISRTPKTQKQIYDYLRQKGYLPKICNIVIEKLLEYRYINDEQYAKNFVNCYEKKYGKKKISFMLMQKGIEKSIIDKVLSDIKPQEDAIFMIAQKYMNNKEKNQQNFDKLCRSLASKGFGWDDISNVINKLKREEE